MARSFEREGHSALFEFHVLAGRLPVLQALYHAVERASANFGAR